MAKLDLWSCSVYPIYLDLWPNGQLSECVHVPRPVTTFGCLFLRVLIFGAIVDRIL